MNATQVDRTSQPHRPPSPAGPPFGNGLGLLLGEQRRLRRAARRRSPAAALSPFASLRRCAAAHHR